MLDENRAMMRIFRNSGYKLVRQLGEGVYRVEYPIEYSLEAREAEWEHEKRSVTASLDADAPPRSRSRSSVRAETTCRSAVGSSATCSLTVSPGRSSR